MAKWDLTIFETQKKEEIRNRFRITKKAMTAAGQHGKAIILIDEQKKEWLLKTFSKFIDFEMNKMLDLEVDIEDSPEESRHRMHLWRVLNELTASRLGQRLRLNVPGALVVCSQQIADQPLEQTTVLDLGDVVILDEDEEDEGDTAEEFYELSERESYTLETSKKFEELLTKKSDRGDPSTILALIMEKIPDTINLDEFLDTKDLDGAFETIQQIDDGYSLLPFDIWLNDPDRNAGNYLVQFDENKKPNKIWGIDYEMWALGSDIWMEEDEITQGRSYLTAVIHTKSNIFDPRVTQTVHRIRSVADEELTSMTRAPRMLCKFFEYHITQKNIVPDERDVLKQVESNLEDFLIESRPRSDKLSDILIRQVGLPSDYKP